MFAKSLSEYSLIRGMACVGATLTPLVIAEIGDVRSFHSKHALIAYAGIDAPPYSSLKLLYPICHFLSESNHVSNSYFVGYGSVIISVITPYTLRFSLRHVTKGSPSCLAT